MELAALWADLVGHMDSMGTCSPAFAPTLLAIMERSLEIRICDGAIDRDGRYTTTAAGRTYAHPACGQRATHMAARERLMEQLGLSPAARTRVKPVEGGTAAPKPLLLRLKGKEVG